jgi:hypothetical protein
MRISLRLLALICIFAGGVGVARARNQSDDAVMPKRITDNVAAIYIPALGRSTAGFRGKKL